MKIPKKKANFSFFSRLSLQKHKMYRKGKQIVAEFELLLEYSYNSLFVASVDSSVETIAASKNLLSLQQCRDSTRSSLK